MTRIRPLVLLAVVALLLGVLAGCGSSDDGPLVKLTAGAGPQFAVAWDATSVGQSGAPAPLAAVPAGIGAQPAAVSL